MAERLLNCGSFDNYQRGMRRPIREPKVLRINKLIMRILNSSLTKLMAVAEDCLRWGRISAGFVAEV